MCVCVCIRVRPMLEIINNFNRLPQHALFSRRKCLYSPHDDRVLDYITVSEIIIVS